MTSRIRVLSVALFTMVLWGCSSHDEEKAKAEFRDSADKTAAEAKKAGAEIKAETKELANKVDAAVKPDGEKASDKLAAGVDKMKDASAKASVKLDRAALLAKVKSELAANAGLSTLTTISVDVSGNEVSLTGSVPTSEQKQVAEQIAAQVEGVTHVHNALIVKP